MRRGDATEEALLSFVDEKVVPEIIALAKKAEESKKKIAPKKKDTPKRGRPTKK